MGGIGGGIGEAPEGYDGHATFYVAVPDVEASLVKAEELGGRRMMGPEAVGPDRQIGLFTDPEGHTVGVVSGGWLRVEVAVSTARRLHHTVHNDR